ncbi:MAG: pyrimidine-nucleoside phosphorylase [Cellulosilyticaceae bacterium]
MRFVDIINKKVEKKVLTEQEIQFWINGVTNGSIPDYQTSALLMAIVLNGMDSKETAALTKAMMHSGDVIDLTSIEGIKADKHSTGGVGDKTSLALGAMVAACGLKVAKMSGRGLGHTGGTLDKLESIAGFNCFLSEEQFINQVKEIGIAIIGQTGDLVPADKKLYALRDVTGTVRAIPLIASSIMSKKLASGSDTILLDVKFGEGAFMRTSEEATELANAMIAIGNELGRNTMAMITDMNQPLGNTIGNSLEVIEAVETLKGQGPKDFTELCLQAGEIMLMQGKVSKSKEEAREMLLEGIHSGRALQKLKDMVKAQGGDVAMIEDITRLPKSKHITEIKSEKTGYISKVHCEELGILAMYLGAGRQTKEDPINFGVGLKINCKTGDQVNAGDTICYVYHDEDLASDWVARLHEAFVFSNEHVASNPIIEKVLS